MINKLAKTISIIFHPLLMPSIGLLIIYNSGSYISLISPEIKKLVFYTIVAGTIIIPISFLPVFKYLNIIKGYQMETKNERILPTILISVLYLITYICLKSFPVSAIIQIYFLVTTLVLFISIIIIAIYKISLHMIAIGGLVGLLFAVSNKLNVNVTSYIIIAILVAGLIGTARLKLNTHNSWQIYLGFIWGFIALYFGIISY